MRGERRLYIIVVEIIPTMTSLIVASFLTNALYAVLFASSLQFIGLGDPNSVSWGTMLYWAENNEALQTGQLPVGDRARRVHRRCSARRSPCSTTPSTRSATRRCGRCGGPAERAELTRDPVRRARAWRPGRCLRSSDLSVELRLDRGTVRAVDDVSASRRRRASSSASSASPAAASPPCCSPSPSCWPRPPASPAGSVTFQGPEPGRADRPAADRGPLAGPVGRHAERDERAQPGQVDRRAVHRRDAGARRDRRGRDRRPVGRGAADGRHRPGAPEELPAPAVRRHAAAGDDRDGAAVHPGPGDHGRAHVRARRGGAALADGADQGAAASSSASRSSSSPTTCRWSATSPTG